MVKNKSIFIIMAMVVAFILGTVGLTVATFINTGEQFLTGGYILDPSNEEIVTTEVNNQYYFNAGTKYKNRYDQYIEFKDINGDKVALDNNKFIHYLDGSLSALSKGVILEANTGVISDQIMYYGISNKTTLVKNGSTYSMNTLDSTMELSEFVWKLSDNTYMVVAPTVTLHLSDSQEVTFDDYAQIEYVKEGIVRIVHQNGTYQTVSSEAYLELPDKVRLNLAGQYFEYDGVEGVSLTDMIVDSDSNVAVKDNNDTVNLPTFNVVNGKDGAPGANGQIGETGEIGTDGNDGADGADGKNGSNGEAGFEGYDGTDGAMGTDGYEGYAGNTGYNGADGEGGYRGADGNDAPNSDPSGIIAVKQLAPPTITLDTTTYKVGSNSVYMDFNIKDDDNLLVSELTLTVIDPKNPNQVVASQPIQKGVTKAFLDLSKLEPNTDYYVVIEGQYDPDNDGADYLDGQFFIKQFKTDLLGIGLRKEKATENSISVAVDFEQGSDIAIYSVLAKYIDESGNEVSVPNEVAKNVTKTSDDSVVFDFTGLESNKEYTFYLANVTLADQSLIPVRESIDVKTLRRSPYITLNDGTQIPVTSSTSMVTPNEREQTVSVTMHALGDPDKGVTKYRYELYETNNADNLDSLIPVQTKESNSLEVVTFDVEREKNYAGRVVVVFDDNEKVVELETQAPQSVMIGEGTFPIASFKNLDKNSDRLEMSVTISDPYKRLLDHVSSDYPLRVVFTSKYGDAHECVLSSANTVDGTTYTYICYQLGLRNDTVYSVSLTGPVVTGSVKWDDLRPEQKNAIKDTYISGVQYDTKQKAIIELAYFDQLGSSSSAFSVAVNTRRYAAQYNAIDPLYVADDNMPDAVAETFGTLNKMTFELKDENGKVLGTTSILDKAHGDLDTVSEFYTEGYSDGATKNPGTTENLILTPKVFGVSDTQLIPGKSYTISLTSVEDYVGNELLFAKSKADFKVDVKENHMMVDDPYNQVVVNEIANVYAPAMYQNDSLAPDAVVGVRIEPKYALGDVLSVKYVAYKVTDPVKAAGIEEKSLITANNADNFGLTRYAQFEKILEDGTSKAPTGNSTISSSLENFWTIYFDKPFANGIDGTEVIFRRGEEYIFRYEVTTSGDYKAACYPTQNDEIYPYCIYKLASEKGIEAGTAVEGDVPFYRSPLYSAKRQAPTVECYPANSDGKNVTWMYRIFDPDGTVALAGTPSVKYKVNSTDNFEGVSDKGSIDCAVVTDVNADFKPVTLKDVGKDNNTIYYYQMRVDYKLEENAPEASKIESDIMTFKAADKNNAKLILNKVIDNGGGEIKFEILGDNLDEYAGVKITVKCALQTDVVVFDYVQFGENPHMKDQKIHIEGTPDIPANYRNFAYAYIDATLLPKDWIGRTVTYSIEGYKDTRSEGLGTLSNSNSAEKFDISDDAAKKMISGFSSEYYVIYDTKNNQYMTFDNLSSTSISGSDFANGSFVIPGSEKAPFQDKVSDTINPYIHLQSTDKELIAVTPETKNTVFKEMESEVAFDQNGMYLVNNLNSRISLRKLKLIAADNQTEPQILKEILPAVKLVNKSSGVKTSKFEFSLNGDLTKYNDFYVKLYKSDDASNLIGLDGQLAEDKFYYTITNPNTSSCTPYHVESADGKNGNMNFYIKGLQPNTKYFIQLYAKVDKGGSTEEVLLYDSEYRMQGRQYEFTTSKNVDIDIIVSDIKPNSYTSKPVSFDYKVSGAGMGYTLYYDIINASGTTVVSHVKLDKKGSLEQFKYYDNVFGSNRQGAINFAPGSGSLIPGNKYSVYIYAIDDTDDNETKIGERTVSFTPRVLKRPTSSYSIEESADSLTLNYAFTDADYVINDVGGLSFTVDMYDPAGTLMDTTVVDGANYSNLSNKLYENLAPNTTYRFVVRANIDLDNDGQVDADTVIDEFTAKTSPDVDADVTAYVSGGKYRVVIYNTKNFDVVKRVSYTIYSSSGATIGSGAITTEDGLDPNGGDYATKPSLNKSGSGMQYISAFFYDENGTLVGSSLNKQFHIE